MPGAAATLRHEMIGLAGVIERNVYLIKRYIWWDVAFFIWTVANTLTIVFIAKGVPSLTPAEVNHLTTVLEHHVDELARCEFLVVSPGQIRIAGHPPS